MMNPKIVSLVIFTASYLLFIFLPKKRPHIAVSAAILLILSGAASFKEAFGFINRFF